MLYDFLKGKKIYHGKILNGTYTYAQITYIDNMIYEYMEKLYQTNDPKFSSISSTYPDYMLTDFQYSATSKSDKSKIDHFIKEFFINLKISPEKYNVYDTKNILINAYQFLSSKFIERISNINQLELLSYLLNCEHAVMLVKHFYQEITKPNYVSKIEDEYNKNIEEWTNLLIIYRHSIEISIKHYSGGSKSFNLKDWLELQAMAEQIIILSLHISEITCGLSECNLRIRDDYGFDIKSSHVKFMKLFSINFNKSLLDDSAFLNYKPFNSDIELYNYINEPFKDEFKINFEKFYQISIIICKYFNMKKSKTKLFRLDELIQSCENFEISSNDLINTLELLSLFQENMVGVFYPSEVRNKPFRHACKPIIKFSHNKTYLINALSLYNVVYRMKDLISCGYLLYNVNHIKSVKLKKCLQNLQSEASAKFEKIIFNLLKLKTDLVELNLKKSNYLLKNISEELPGEIDSIAIFSNAKIIYIIEAKCINMNYGPRDIKNEIQKFQKSGGFIDKFDKKVKFIKNHLSEILKYYKIYDTDNWKVESYFVTCNLSFFKGLSTKYPSLSLDDLKEKISTF